MRDRHYIGRSLFILSCVLAGLAWTACSDAGGFPDAAVIDSVPAPGGLSFRWSITLNGVQSDCAAVGAVNMVAVVENIDSAEGTNELFGCSAGTTPGMAISSGVASKPPGRYRAIMSLYGAASVGEILRLPAIGILTVATATETVVPPQIFAVIR
jgi:hypothetical protein